MEKVKKSKKNNLSLKITNFSLNDQFFTDEEYEKLKTEYIKYRISIFLENKQK